MLALAGWGHKNWRRNYFFKEAQKLTWCQLGGHTRNGNSNSLLRKMQCALCASRTLRPQIIETTWSGTVHPGLHRTRRDAPRREKGGSLVLKFRWGSAVRRNHAGSVSTVRYAASTITCQITVGRIPRMPQSILTLGRMATNWSKILQWGMMTMLL